MKKDKKIKVISSVVLSTKKFNKIRKSKNSSFEITSEKIIITAKIAELKKRIQFILSLICDFSTEIGIRICDENEMLSSNTYYRGKNYPTDVLSFPYSDDLPNESEYSYLGDILICLPVCYNQAKKARVTISQELEKMIIHALLLRS